MSITITLPIPPPAVRPNGRAHWRAKANAVRKCREAAAAGGLLVSVVNKWPVRRCSLASLRIDWYHPTRRLLDRDNIIASSKAYIDGIVDAGVLSDDRDVTFEPVGRFVDKANPRVEITITPTDPHE